MCTSRTRGLDDCFGKWVPLYSSCKSGPIVFKEDLSKKVGLYTEPFPSAKAMTSNMKKESCMNKRHLMGLLTKILDLDPQRDPRNHSRLSQVV